MGLLAVGLFNVISGLVVDKATDLAKEHVDKMLDDVLPDSAKKELDKIIKADPTHVFDNAKDALQASVEGKLPIPLKDGKLLPVELSVTVRFDPNTGKLEIVN